MESCFVITVCHRLCFCCSMTFTFAPSNSSSIWYAAFHRKTPPVNASKTIIQTKSWLNVLFHKANDLLLRLLQSLFWLRFCLFRMKKTKSQKLFLILTIECSDAACYILNY